MSVEKIINYVKKWINEIEKVYSNVMNTEVIREEFNSYRVIFTLEHCMAEIIINEPDFALYKNVMFQAGAIENNNYINIYTWYDCNDESISNIIEKLNNGILFIIDYNSKKL